MSLLLSATGCGGSGGPSTAVELTPAQRHKLRTAPSPEIVIKLPQGQPFNVQDKRWNSTPGASGKANPLADATPTGTAFCRADGENGGASWAECQLGHGIDNETGRAVQAEVRMTIDYEYACKATDGGTGKTTALFAIKAFVKSTDGKVLRTLPLASHTSDDGAIRWSGTERTITELTMQPNLGYYIVVSARADATSGEKGACQAEVKVKSLAMEIVCK